MEVELGKIVEVKDRKGKVLVEILNSDILYLADERIVLTISSGYKEVFKIKEIQKVSAFNSIIEFEGINTREDASKFIGANITVASFILESRKINNEADIETLEQEQGFIGHKVFDTNLGYIGDVIKLTNNGFYDTITVLDKDKGREVMIPCVDEFIKDVTDEKIDVNLIEGMV